MVSYVVLLSFVCSAIAAGWNYDRCDSKNGPKAWSGVCQTGTEQTPINLCNAISFPSTVPTISVTGYSTARSVSGYNPGYTTQINIDGSSPPTLTTTLASVIGRSTATSAETWNLAQMHIHVGRTGLTTEGSEHYITNRAYPIEAHFVHFNSKYGTISAAVNSGNKDALLVVGVMFEIGTTDANTMVVMADAASSMTKTAKTLSTQVTLSDVYDGTGAFYSYRGGLTTPTCNEIVTWVVMKNSKPITEGTLNKFKASTVNPTSALKFAVQADGSGTQGQYGTFRPLQAISGRNIWVSDTISGSCSSVTEPTYICVAATSGSSVFCPSFALPLLILGWLSYTQC